MSANILHCQFGLICGSGHIFGIYNSYIKKESENKQLYHNSFNFDFASDSCSVLFIFLDKDIILYGNCVIYE